MVGGREGRQHQTRLERFSRGLDQRVLPPPLDGEVRGWGETASVTPIYPHPYPLPTSWGCVLRTTGRGILTRIMWKSL